jgi:RHS repeat-associated protein
LGSITAITSETGQVVSASAFDPWGQRRDAQAWHPWQAPSPGALATMRGITPRGYTGHEHLDALGIIHMNGRIYDPHLGRFLQADILIEDTGTLNRYTYVHNNPLAYTDPTGHFSIGRLLRTVAAIAISVYTGGAVGGQWLFFGKALEGAAAFAAVVGAGALSGAISSGTIEGAAWGAFSGAVFFGIGQGLGNADWAKGSFAGKLSGPGFAVKTISHGLAGGTISTLQGGKFGHGFVSAAGSAATAPFLDVESAGGVWKGGVLTALVGGTLSSASGGKFANGAVTAAMSYAFNSMAHYRASRQSLAKRYSSEKPYYHEYEGEWAICNTGQEWCTQQRGLDSLTHFAFPGQDSSMPVVHRQVSEVFFAGSSAGHIETRVEPSTFSIYNITRPDHMFYDGYVRRSLQWRDGTLYLKTYGEGNNQNFYRWFQNVTLWRPGFNQYNHRFQQHMIQSWLKESM